MPKNDTSTINPKFDLGYVISLREKAIFFYDWALTGGALFGNDIQRCLICETYQSAQRIAKRVYEKTGKKVKVKKLSLEGVK